MIMKVIRTSVFIGAILLGIAATATVSAWSGKYTGIHETAVRPDDNVVWDQRAWVYWRNHTESSVELNWTSHRVRYISGTADSATFTAHHIVADGNDNIYVDEDASEFELEYGEAWHENWEYGGGRSNKYIIVQKISGSITAYMISKESEFHKLSQEISFYNDDDGDPAICMSRFYPFLLQTIKGPDSDCPF